MALKCPHDPQNHYKKSECKKIKKTGYRVWCKACPHFREEEDDSTSDGNRG